MVTPSPTNKPLGCRLNINHHWRWEYPPEGKKFGRCVKCAKINDSWVGSNWTESWKRFGSSVAYENSMGHVGRRYGDDGQDATVTEAADAYGEASRAYDELIERFREHGHPPTEAELKAAGEKRAAG